MPPHTFTHRGYEITIHPEQNKFGAWRAKVTVRQAAEKIAEFSPETVQPEWLTQEEAVRDGLEWATRLIDHKLTAPPDEA